MNFTTLATTDISISKLALGCMSFHTQEQGRPIIEAALDAGINFFDTADLYDKGENENILGNVLVGKRQEVIIATKVGNRWKNDGSGWEWVPQKAYIVQAVEESLRRLQTDYIDLYQLHGGTIDDPLDEVVEAFELLKEQGKIRAYGISSIRPNTIRKWTSLSKGATCMSQYSLFDRRPEEFILNHLHENNQQMLVRGALAKGLLAGKVAKSYLGKSEEEVRAIQAKINTISAPNSVLSTALHYVLSKPSVGAVLLGASSTNQLAESVKNYNNCHFDQEKMDLLASQIEADVYAAHR